MADPNDGTIRGLRFARVLVWLVYAFFVVAMVILLIAFFLQLFNASTSADFTRWVYRSADRLMEPFRGIFPQETVGEGGSIINFAMAFAIIMYGIFALAVHALVGWLDRQIRRRRLAVEREAAEERARVQYQAAALQQGQPGAQQVVPAQPQPTSPGQPGPGATPPPVPPAGADHTP